MTKPGMHAFVMTIPNLKRIFLVRVSHLVFGASLVLSAISSGVGFPRACAGDEWFSAQLRNESESAAAFFAPASELKADWPAENASLTFTRGFSERGWDNFEFAELAFDHVRGSGFRMHPFAAATPVRRANAGDTIPLGAGASIRIKSIWGLCQEKIITPGANLSVDDGRRQEIPIWAVDSSGKALDFKKLQEPQKDFMDTVPRSFTRILVEFEVVGDVALNACGLLDKDEKRLFGKGCRIYDGRNYAVFEAYNNSPDMNEGMSLALLAGEDGFETIPLPTEKFGVIRVGAYTASNLGTVPGMIGGYGPRVTSRSDTHLTMRASYIPNAGATTFYAVSPMVSHRLLHFPSEARPLGYGGENIFQFYHKQPDALAVSIRVPKRVSRLVIKLPTLPPGPSTGAKNPWDWKLGKKILPGEYIGASFREFELLTGASLPDCVTVGWRRAEDARALIDSLPADATVRQFINAYFKPAYDAGKTVRFDPIKSTFVIDDPEPAKSGK